MTGARAKHALKHPSLDNEPPQRPLILQNLGKIPILGIPSPDSGRVSSRSVIRRLAGYLSRAEARGMYL
jgi:hypothetical protein